MSVEANEALVRRLFDDVWSTGNVALVDDLLAPSFVDHAAEMGGGDATREGFKAQVRQFRSAFPDGQSRIEDLMAVGDRVVARWTDGGTHLGAWQGVPPTGKRVSFGGIDIYCIQDGRVVEYWCSEDELGLLRQVGGISPAP